MRRLGTLLVLACLTLASHPAAAQAPYPNRLIRILVPYGPGGLTDVVARLYAEQLRKSLGQNVLVENKPGASGIIAIEEMARAKPDGNTIMVGNISTNCLTPVLLAKRMHIDYDRDVQIIARTADAPPTDAVGPRARAARPRATDRSGASGRRAPPTPPSRPSRRSPRPAWSPR